ncbi:MAG: hypothetical protein ACRD4O_13550, partial [Bryobacteraceae bacterium]
MQSGGRLTQATNPESGTVSYAYDSQGNATSRTDARGVTTTYTYDALNRLTGKSYSNGTPAVSYAYDGSGHLTSIQNGNSATNFTSFDTVGNITASSQVTAGQTYSFAYSYNLAGALTSETYPSGRVVSTAYDGAGRAATITGNLNGQITSYITQTEYWPHGALQAYWAGNGTVPVWIYDSRLRISQNWVTIDNENTRFLYLMYPNWGTTNSNGNLQSIEIYAGGPGTMTSLPTFTTTFGYDGANRLTSASDTGGWSRSYGYDPWGNMWVTGNSGVSPAGNTPTSDVYNGANRINSAGYDAAGNDLTVNGDTLTY